jgi:hypothetical protein
LYVGGVGDPVSAVLDLPLSSSFTSLHDLFHSTAFVVARKRRQRLSSHGKAI